jgi:hypothetical protein
MEYVIVATAMRAVRLYALLLAMGIMTYWGPSLWRLVTRRAPALALVRNDPPHDVALDREITRAIWAVLAFAVFLIQVRWLSPWLPEVAQMRVWLIGLTAVDVVLLAAIFHHGRADMRFSTRRTAIVWGANFVICLAFALVSR